MSPKHCIHSQNGLTLCSNIRILTLTPSARWRYCYRHGNSSTTLRWRYPYRHDLLVSSLHKQFAGVHCYIDWTSPVVFAWNRNTFQGGVGEGYSLRLVVVISRQSLIDHYGSTSMTLLSLIALEVLLLWFLNFLQ